MLLRPFRTVWVCLGTVAGCSGGQSGGEERDISWTPECTVEAECLPRAEDSIGSLLHPITAYTRTTSSSECSNVGFLSAPGGQVSGPTCICHGNTGDVMLGPVGMPCYTRGRAGECLFDDADFRGCSESDDTCETACALADTRINADLARGFSAQVRQVSCMEGTCRSIVEIDGLCYEGDAFKTGLSQECSAFQEMTPSAPTQEAIPQPLSLVEGTAGSVLLEMNSIFHGSASPLKTLSARAWFAHTTGSSSVRFETVLDPLEGIDDCGVFVPGASGTTDIHNDFFPVNEAILIDGGQRYPLQPFTSGSDFYSYWLDLTANGINPRYGGTYGFNANGGELESAIDSATLSLPEELDFPLLQHVAHQPRGDLSLLWIGDGTEPLHLTIGVATALGGIPVPTHIECNVHDDRGFIVRARFLDQLPDGVLTLSASREIRALSGDGAKALLTLGSVTATHNLAFGEVCERTNVRDACLVYADALHAAEFECGVAQTPIEQACPDYLTTLCAGCPEYFACMTETATCGPDGYVEHGVCGCR
jgi:hypothetical protein